MVRSTTGVPRTTRVQSTIAAPRRVHGHGGGGGGGHAASRDRRARGDGAVQPARGRHHAPVAHPRHDPPARVADGDPRRRAGSATATRGWRGRSRRARRRSRPRAARSMRSIQAESASPVPLIATAGPPARGSTRSLEPRAGSAAQRQRGAHVAAPPVERAAAAHADGDRPAAGGHGEVGRDVADGPEGQLALRAERLARAAADADRRAAAAAEVARHQMTACPRAPIATAGSSHRPAQGRRGQAPRDRSTSRRCMRSDVLDLADVAALGGRGAGAPVPGRDRVARPRRCRPRAAPPSGGRSRAP